MAKARHRKPSVTKTAVKRSVVVGGTAALAMGATVTPAFANGPEAWDVIARCESGMKNIENAGPSTASGFFQIIDGTWAGAGGLQFAPRAIDATYEQQLTVAQQIAMERGSLADWNASKACWGDEITSAVPSAVPAAPAPVAEPAPAPVEPAPVTKEVVTAGATYTVVEGDTLIKIGAQVGKSWEELAALNGITDPWTIFPGQVLKVEEDKVEYVVVEGDTLSDIGEELDTPWHEIYEENVTTIGDNPDFILPGQVLFVGGLRLPQAPVTIEESRPVEEESPVEATTQVVNGYANPLPGGTLNQAYSIGHGGVDLGAPKGTPIYSASAGTVTVAGPRDPDGFGQAVYITGDDGYDYWYGHIDTWNVTPGQHVAAGDLIATVGNRGNSYGANGGYHLHFEVRIGPGSVNPSNVIGINF